MDFKTTVT